MQELKDLVRATEQALFILKLPSRGRPATTGMLETNFGRSLVREIRRIWGRAGRRNLAIHPEGPLVGVLCQAMEAVDGMQHEGKTVASALKRIEKRAKNRS